MNFKSVAFFSLRSSLKEGLLKCSQINQKIPVMLQAEGMQLYPKYAPLQVLSKVLLRFVDIYNEFLDILETFVSQNTS